MKKHYWLVNLIVVSTIMFISCSAGGSPSMAFKNCLEAAEKGDMKKFSMYVVDGDKFYEEYQKASESERQMATVFMTAFMSGISSSDYEIVDESIDGDKATLKLEWDNYGMSMDKTIAMKKENGRWKVDMDKF